MCTLACLTISSDPIIKRNIVKYSKTTLIFWWWIVMTNYFCRMVDQSKELRWLAWLIKNCVFMDWFYRLIKWFKIAYKSLDKVLLFSRNQVFCLKVWKRWQAPTTLQFSRFCWNFTHFPTYQCQQKGVGFFRSWVICKN